MAELSALINWENATYAKTSIGERTVCRFRAIGNFLKSHELPEVLTWEAIDKALPPLTKKSRATTKFIRSGLMDLGHLHAIRGELPDWKTYRTVRMAREMSASAPPAFCANVLAFQAWAEGGMLNPKLTVVPGKVQILCNTPKSIGEALRTIVNFLSWCAARNTYSLTNINAPTIIDYLSIVLWEYECRVCKNCIPFEAPAPTSCLNDQCREARSYGLRERLSRSEVNRRLSDLRMFFDWALLHELVTENPARDQLCSIRALPFANGNGLADDRRIGRAIRRYGDEVIMKLGAYIFSPEADAEEALVLYFIIFHLCTVQEVCGLRVPSCVTTNTNAEGDYEGLLFTPEKLTRGHRATRRSRGILKFPPRTAVRLRPLLDSHYENRKRLIKTDQYEYFLAMNNRCRHNKPVSEAYVQSIVKRASLRVLREGEVCASRLRITAASLFSKKSKKRSGVLSPLGYRSAHTAAFNYLEEVILPLKTRIPSKDRRL